MKNLPLMLVLVISLAGSSAYAASVTLPDIGGGTLTFDESQFVVSESFTSGVTEKPDAQGHSIVGHELGTWAAIGSTAQATLGFSGHLLNGPGADLWVYELGILEDIAIQIVVNGSSNIYSVTFTGQTVTTTAVNDSGREVDVNLAAIDLSDFGYSEGDVVAQPIYLSSGGQSPDVAVIAANTVPAPAAIFAGAALLGLIGLRRRRG